MTDNSEINACVNCENTEQNVPLVAMRFNGNSGWICSQCLPILIHNPQRLTEKLPGIETIPVPVR